MGVSGLDEGVTRGDAGLVLVACREGVARGLGCLGERRFARGGVGELGAARVDLTLRLGEGVKGVGLLALELLAARASWSSTLLNCSLALSSASSIFALPSAAICCSRASSRSALMASASALTSSTSRLYSSEKQLTPLAPATRR